jgi:hypothetical protein
MKEKIESGIQARKDDLEFVKRLGHFRDRYEGHMNSIRFEEKLRKKIEDMLDSLFEKFQKKLSCTDCRAFRDVGINIYKPLFLKQFICFTISLRHNRVLILKCPGRKHFATLS